MLITRQLATKIRAIEAYLKEQLDYDETNCFHIAKLLNEPKCIALLETQLLSEHCIDIYQEFIYPMYFRLEWANNYLTPSQMAEDYDLNVGQVKSLIDEGREIQDSLIERERAYN